MAERALERWRDPYRPADHDIRTAAPRLGLGCRAASLQPLQLLLGPDCIQLVAAPLAPVDDLLPRVDGFLAAAHSLQQKGAHVQRPDVVRVELERAAPVGERSFPVACTRAR